MGMNFGLRISAGFTHELDADDVISRYDVDTDMLNMPGRVELDDVEVEGRITISGSFSIDGIEVSASQLSDFDAESALEGEGIEGDFSNVEFEVEDSPSGFDEVVQAVGYDRDLAIEVYAALDNAGYTVS